MKIPKRKKKDVLNPEDSDLEEDANELVWKRSSGGTGDEFDVQIDELEDVEVVYTKDKKPVLVREMGMIM